MTSHRRNFTSHDHLPPTPKHRFSRFPPSTYSESLVPHACTSASHAPQPHARHHGHPHARRAAHAGAAHAEAPGQGFHGRLRRPRRALLHELRRRLHLQGPRRPRVRLRQSLRPQMDGHPATCQRALPGAQRQDHAADAKSEMTAYPTPTSPRHAFYRSGKLENSPLHRDEKCWC